MEANARVIATVRNEYRKGAVSVRCRSREFVLVGVQGYASRTKSRLKSHIKMKKTADFVGGFQLCEKFTH